MPVVLASPSRLSQMPLASKVALQDDAALPCLTVAELVGATPDRHFPYGTTSSVDPKVLC